MADVPVKELAEVIVFGEGELAREVWMEFFVVELLFGLALEGRCVEMPWVELATDNDTDVEW